MEVFRRLSHDERTYEAERLTGLIKKWRVPGRIRAEWEQRIRLGTVFHTGPQVEYTSDKLPWED
jgi:hypothetical protein